MEKCVRTSCVVCGRKETMLSSLSLTEKYGFWVVNLVCEGCRAALKKLAARDNKSLPPNEQTCIRFYDMDYSLVEANRRNEMIRRNPGASNQFGRQELRPQFRIASSSR